MHLDAFLLLPYIAQKLPSLIAIHADLIHVDGDVDMLQEQAVVTVVDVRPESGEDGRLTFRRTDVENG